MKTFGLLSDSWRGGYPNRTINGLMKGFIMPAYIIYLDFKNAIQQDTVDFTIQAKNRIVAIEMGMKLFNEELEFSDSEVVSVCVIETNFCPRE
jgi:hypothetical protein